MCIEILKYLITECKQIKRGLIKNVWEKHKRIERKNIIIWKSTETNDLIKVKVIKIVGSSKIRKCKNK